MTLIKREDAIDACCRGWNNTVEDCIRNIKEIPSAWYKGMECAQDIISAQPLVDIVSREFYEDAVNDGDPVGYLTAKEAFDYLEGDKDDK